jgi:D-alanyl-D-alanine carboxypeptidase
MHMSRHEHASMVPVSRRLIALLVATISIGGCLGGSPSAVPEAVPAAVSVPTAAATPTPAPGGTPAPSERPGPTAPSPLPASPPASLPTTSSSTIVPRPGAATATATLVGALDERLDILRAKYGIPGVSVAIVFADGSVWRGDSGLADVAARRPVTADTAFSVASVSKTFTAALILALVEDGRLSLDSTARTYLPNLKIDPTITVRELLDHTSGLRDFYLDRRIDKALLAKRSRVWDPARSLSYVGKPFAKPGVSWHYSNTNYLVLGLLAEAVGGAPVANQLRERFFTPLGLDHTWYQAVEPPRGPLAHGYRFTGTNPKLPAIDLSDGTRVAPFTSVITASGAAGSIASTSTDLAQWARALYGGDALEAGSRGAMIADITRTARLKPPIGYGLGVQGVTIAGLPAFGHSGRFLGSRAVMRWIPSEQIAVAIVTNQSRTDPNLLLADLLGLAMRPVVGCVGCPTFP